MFLIASSNAYPQGGSVYNVKSLPSGIAAHVAAAQYGPCL